MLASSTHDTKRSEDVRARIDLLSETPDRWKEALHRWAQMNAKYKNHDYPDRNTEYLLYQSMIGAWPISTERLIPYIQKATREAKQQTNWLSPNKEFEEATPAFIEAIYKDKAFIADLEAFIEPLVEPGRINSLAQLLLKLTSPGIPDTYQGTELWDLSLVDPDNRRPVDYDLRRRLLSELPKLKVEDVWRRIDEGLPKMWTFYHGVRARGEQSRSFGPEGAYTPLSAKGGKAENAVAYQRGENVIVIVPRLVTKLAGNWDDTSLDIPSGAWRDRLSGSVARGGSLRLAETLGRFPIALLIRD
jgi:(1->4)-alpha-D-glucan 1-alpha-D-glucosylmutase